MKKLIVLFVTVVLSMSAFSQVITFKKYYQKSSPGSQPELIDQKVRTIAFMENVVVVTNLFGCEYTSEYRIVEKISNNKYIIAYEGQEVILIYSAENQMLVVTVGKGVIGENNIHLYAEY